MKLKRLILQGFKSFKDKTVVHFDDGITGIVGPNGCGKSNIVDALFWVMGEMSAKHLRGKSMKDLIFAGSSKYNPAAWAEVSLVLENTKQKHIHIGDKVVSPNEIQLTRKLYRNGETEYRINGSPARLKDIQEVFMDTGAGAKSYSIIAQGEINRLVQAKPEERRVMIEEVAGITKFKLRKRESLKKIDQTNQNLNRLQDLQTEIYKNLKSLERQSEKAERARTLKAKIERTYLTVQSHKEFDYLRELREINTFLQEKRLEVEGWNTRKETLEVSLEEERIKKTELMEKVDQDQEQYNELSRELAGAEERLNYLRRTITEKQEQVETREKENQKLEEEIEDRSARLEELSEQLETMRDSKADEFDFSDLENRVEVLKDKLEMRESTLSELRAEMDEEKKAYYEAEQELFRLTSKANDLSQSVDDITAEIEDLEQQYSSVSTDISKEREQVNEAKSRKDELETKVESLTDVVTSLRDKSREQDQVVRGLNKSFITKDSQRQSLQTLNESMLDQTEGNRLFLEDHKESAALLGSLIECDSEYTNAVQALLRSMLNSIAIKNNGKVELNWFEQKAINAEFIRSQTHETISLPADRFIELTSLVRVNDENYAHLKDLFSGYYIDKIMTADSAPEGDFLGITNLDGSLVVEKVGSRLKTIVFGAENESGIVARNNQIKDLEEELVTLKSDLEQAEAVLAEVSTNLATSEQELEEAKTCFSAATTEFATLKTALDAKTANLETGNGRLKILRDRKNSYSQERLIVLEREEELTQNRDSSKEDMDDKESAIAEMSDEVMELRTSYTEVKEELLEKQMEAKTYDERLENLESQVSDVEEQVKRAQEKLTVNSDIVEKYNNELDGIETSIQELTESNATEAEALADKKSALDDLKDTLSELLVAMQGREDEAKKLTADINKTEKNLVSKEARLQQILIDESQIVRDTFEKYQVDVRDVISRFLEMDENELLDLEDISTMYVQDVFNEETQETEQTEIEKVFYEFNRRYGQDLKDQKHKLKKYKQDLNRLGEINWQAIEDYDRQKVRHQFLKEQEEELKASLVDLESAIEHIDEKSKTRFKEAFNEVNVRFEKVFPIIFGGGNAKLKITGDIDSADCGVDIIAQPPGKKMQNINLMSGGEKAMTAVSLIFSIFLVKPSPFCLLDEVDAPLDDANVGRFNDLLKEMSQDSQFILITHNKKTMELNDTLYGVTMQEAGVSSAVSVRVQ